MRRKWDLYNSTIARRRDQHISRSTPSSVMEICHEPRQRRRKLFTSCLKVKMAVVAVPFLLWVTSSARTVACKAGLGVDLDTTSFQGLQDHSPLARTMTRPSGKDPYTITTPGAEALRLSHGTTTVAMLFDGGVIAAVDSRASMGSFVGSRTTQKVIPVSDRILGTMAGGAADCTFWLRYLGMQAGIFEARNGRPMSVATAARLLADTLLMQRGRGLSMGTMIMGYEDGGGDRGAGEEGGKLHYVDSDGARVKGRYFSVGSGSTYAYSVLDEWYRPDMTLEEAASLARRAVRHATYRDAFSGGFINVFVVDASGWSRLGTDDSGFMEVQPGEDELDCGRREGDVDGDGRGGGRDGSRTASVGPSDEEGRP